MKHVTCIYDGTSVPGDTECYAAIWSRGRSCAKCHRSDCYRQGWAKVDVDNDNKKLVAQEQLRHATATQTKAPNK